MALRIMLFGTIAAERDGRAVPLDGLRQSERALLAILALRRDGIVPRDELAEAVFGHLAPERVAANLRVALSRLRGALGDPNVIESRDGSYRLTDTVRVDVADFEAHTGRARAALREGRADSARAELETALGLYRGDVIAVDPSAEWEALRTRLRRKRVEAYEDLADAHLSLGRPRDASASAERAVEIDPTRESAYRRLMTAHYAAGEQDAALAAYERCRNILADELGVNPLPETMTLHERILQRVPIAVRSASATNAVPGLPFVGREAERIALEAAIARAAQDRVLVLVVGEAGAGKTRLVTESVARRSDIAVLATRCYERERELPFQPIREVLGDRAPEPRTDAAADEARRSLIEAYAAAVLAAADGRPLVWTIDDVQWADVSTLDVLHFVLRRSTGAHVAVVAAGRQDELPPEHSVMRLLMDLRREGHGERIALMPLAADDVVALARATGMSSERAVAVHSRSGGNAFFVTELLMALRRGSTSLPETARDAVLARTHVLPEEAREALRAAAVLGGRFQAIEVAAVSRLDTDAVARALGALEAHDLVRPIARAEFELVHDLVRDSVYGDIPAAVRAELHRRAIEALMVARGESAASLICYHAELAGDAECAFGCAVKAGEHALADFAGNEAIASFDRALRQPSDAASRQRCLTLRAEAKRRLGLLDAADADIAAAAALG
jgi:DNA-binding SARP family transcriptional activator